jgi:hypothetical protein
MNHMFDTPADSRPATDAARAVAGGSRPRCTIASGPPLRQGTCREDLALVYHTEACAWANDLPSTVPAMRAIFSVGAEDKLASN